MESRHTGFHYYVTVTLPKYVPKCECSSERQHGYIAVLVLLHSVPACMFVCRITQEGSEQVCQQMLEGAV